MKPLTRLAIPVALLLAACGDDVTEINANVGAVKTSDDLPECTESIAGQTAYIKETHEFLGCDGSEWQTLSANTVSVGDNVCTSTSLSDGTGFEIFCNGESIGTVKNGKDGAAGKDGAPGEKGDKGDNGTNGTGCKIQESTALTATIACGTQTFTMDLTGYVEQPAACDTTLHPDACAAPEDDMSLSGVSQKGPFVRGTDVTAYELEAGNSLKQTGKTFGGKIESTDGSFSVRTVKLKSYFIYLVAEGFYRNEVTGKNSTATITLRALTDLKNGRKTANVNLVTHLEYDRVQRLVTKEDSSISMAKKATEYEIFHAFGIDTTGFKGYAEDFNILEEGKGNAALLAISALIQGDRNESELTSLLAALSIDFGDNGLWDDSLQRARIADWAMKKDLEGGLAAIRANVEGWGISTTKAPAFETPFRNFWMKELGVGECSTDGALFATKNVYSAYYAAKDSVFTAGDSSLVRLICAADGDSYAWRFATDVEKDVAAFAAADDGSVNRGSIDTTNVYVKENSNWRRGTELDATLDFSCVLANSGKTDSMIVKHDTTWYICDKDDDASVPSWRKATNAEADTAGFGSPDRDTVRTGNVEKSNYYVFEKVNGEGAGEWRYGTDMDWVLGPCTQNSLGSVQQVPDMENPLGWYKCATNGIVVVNGKLPPYAWREASDIEKDTSGWGVDGFNDGDVKIGTVNKFLLYVFQDHSWRHGTALDTLLGEVCLSDGQISANKSPGTELYYVCTNQLTPDTVRKWVPASDLYNDTHDAEGECEKLGEYGFGNILIGRVNTHKRYVCDEGVFRRATDKEIGDDRACVPYIHNYIYRIKGYFSKCLNDGTWASVVERDSGIVNDAAGQEYKTVIIGNQQWMAKNVNYDTLNKIESYCYDDLPNNCDKYGRLYTWNMAMVVCPAGWHLPSQLEWKTLIDVASGEDFAGSALKSIDYDEWGEWRGIDRYGFSGLPAGYMKKNGECKDKNVKAYFWSSTKPDKRNAYDVIFYNTTNSAEWRAALDLEAAASVRCVQD